MIVAGRQVQPRGNRIGVVLGTDHGSLPSAINHIREAGVQCVFHAAEEGALSDRWGWGVLCLDEVSWDSHDCRDAHYLLQFVHDRSEAIVTDHCYFAPSGMDWLERMADGSTDPAIEQELHELFHSDIVSDRPLVFAPCQRAFIANWHPGCTVSVAVPAPSQLLSAAVLEGQADGRWIASPGNCRRHMFCIYDTKARVLSWHTCG